MALLATAIFIALFVFGQNYFGWSDPKGQISVSLFACFVLGMVAGFKARS